MTLRIFQIQILKYKFKDVITIGSMIDEFQIFNTEGLFSIVRILFH